MKKLVSTLAALLACGVFAMANEIPQGSTAPQIGQAAATMSGALKVESGKFFLTDEASGVTVEVRGERLQKYVGKSITVTGQVTPGPAGSPEVLIVTGVSRTAAVAGKTAAAGIKAGMSKAAIVGIAGAGTAATVGSLYATDVIAGEEAPVSRK